MLATDRDLLVLEPSLWRDVAFVAQSLARTTGNLASGVLTITGAGVNLASLGVDTGHVALVDSVPVEILARTANTTASVSLLRAAIDGAAIPPGNVTAKSVLISTFAPQIALAHAQVLRLAGIEPSLPPSPDAPGEAQIVNAPALRLLVCLGALHHIYAAASALSGAGMRTGQQTPTAQRAQMYRDRFAHERSRTVVLLDLNADGLPDARRPLASAPLHRA